MNRSPIPPQRLRLYKTRLDCWYQPHRDPGQKAKPPKRVVVVLTHEAADSDDAIKLAVKWADDNAPGSKGRRLLSIEHRSTGTLKLPIVEIANV